MKKQILVIQKKKNAILLNRCHLLEQGNTCELLNTMSFEDVNDFREYLAERNIQCVIGIHLWRAGKLLIGTVKLLRE